MKNFLYLRQIKLPIMKRLTLTLMLTLVAILPLSAEKVWTVETVPNTRLQSNVIHVSDPDGFLSPEAEMQINTALNAIRSDADVFLVALSTIGGKNSKKFANKLFNTWGIGDKETHNGFLLLFVEDQHKFELEPGYGIEPIMTDAKCFEIFNKTIKPYFKKGAYEEGMLAGVNDIVAVFGGTVPQELLTTLPDEKIYEKAKAEMKEDEGALTLLDFVMLLLFIVSAVSFYRLVKRRKTSKIYKEMGGDDGFKDTQEVVDYEGRKCILSPGTTWSGSVWVGKPVARFVTYGLSAFVIMIVAFAVGNALSSPEHPTAGKTWTGIIALVVYLTLICVVHNRRTLQMAKKLALQSLNPRKVIAKGRSNKDTFLVNFMAFWTGIYYSKKYNELERLFPEMICPECGRPMEIDASAKLSEKDEAEMEHRVWKIRFFRCSSGHAYMVKEKEWKYYYYTDCEHCGMHLGKKKKTTIIQRETWTDMGRAEVEYECEFCHHKSTRIEDIPMTSSYNGDEPSYYSSSSSDSGSFGGGSSGGGGYSGSW